MQVNNSVLMLDKSDYNICLKLILLIPPSLPAVHYNFIKT